MTSEAILHPVLASTTVAEQTHDLTQQFKNFYDRHHTTFSVAGVLSISMFLTRVLVRHELTRLKFIVEVVTDPTFESLDGFDFSGD